MIFHTENKYQIYGLNIISAGEHSSPLHKQFIEFLLNNMQIHFVGATIGRPLWFTKISGGQQMISIQKITIKLAFVKIKKRESFPFFYFIKVF